MCELNDELRKMAENELKESDENRMYGIKVLRDWVDKTKKNLILKI